MKSPKTLTCLSCGRTDIEGPNFADPITYEGIIWCSHCAEIRTHENGSKFVISTSVGRMSDSSGDVVAILKDCYETKPKKRIKVANAKKEITRAWENWDGEKNEKEAVFGFYCWLTRYRPYFLTFVTQTDLWQRVNCWILEYERKKK